MDRRRRLADLLITWQERTSRGEAVSAEELCRAHPDLLADVQRLMRLDEAARTDERTALEAELDTSATDLAAAAPVPPGEMAGWLGPPQAPGELGSLGKYRVRRVIRSGGMGIVLEADDPVLKRRVAIKVMHPRLAADATSRGRFLREAEAMARVDHEHVVPVYEAAEDPTARVAYLVMPFLKGEPLDARLRRDNRLTPAEVIWIGREVALGLQAAHDHGLIHRDVKPSNIWIDPRGKVKLLDFGLARAGDADASLSAENRVIGTPAYMAPEQARGETVDARADLFSLGCVLYRAATGSVPFAGSSSMATMYSIATAASPDPQAVNPGLPIGLSKLIKRLLAKDPADRPGSAREVARELATLDREEADTVVRSTVTVTPPPPEDPWSDIATPAPSEALGPGPQPSRRSRWPFVVGTIAGVLLIGAAATALYVFGVNRGTVLVEPANQEAQDHLQRARVQLWDDNGGMYEFATGESSRSVPPGSYRVSIADGERLDPNPSRVEVRRGETAVVRVIRAPNMVVPIRPKKDPPKKDAPTEPDVSAAEWVHGLGGTVALAVPGGKFREVGPKDALPPGPFAVRAIGITSAPVAGGLHRLVGLTELQSLVLTNCQVTNADLAHVGGLGTLKELVVRTEAEPGRVTDAGLAHLAKLTQLKILTLAGQPVTDAGLAHLSELTSLKEVGFAGTRITGTGFAHLRKSTGLEEIHGIGTPTDLGMAHLPHYKLLTYVDLGDGLNVTDTGLKHLAGLAHLEKVIAHNSRLTDDGLKALSGLIRLRALGADGTGLTDEGVSQLKSFPHLESLGIGATSISDVGLKAIGELKNLKWLNVRQTKATADGVKDLHKALPACRVESDHGVFEPD